MAKFKILLVLIYVTMSAVVYAQDDTPTLTVTGQVQNGTLDGTIPGDMSIVLHIVDPNFDEQTQSAAVAADGTFVFDDIPANEDYVYYATVFYGNGYFISDFAQWQHETALHLGITVYDITADPDALHIEHILMQIVPQPTAGTLQIVQMISLQNVSDRLYITDEVIDDYRQASVEFQLPAGAQVVSFMDGEDRLIWSQDTGVVTDTLPVFPDEEHIVHIIYTVPFTESVTLALPLPYRIEGAVDVLLADPLTLSDGTFAVAGQEDVDGVLFTNLISEQSRNAGDTLQLAITTQGATGQVSESTLALIVVAIAAIIVSGAVIWFLTHRQTENADPIDSLVQQIADLDSAYADGAIADADYQSQRKQLKQRLAALMSEQS